MHRHHNVLPLSLLIASTLCLASSPSIEGMRSNDVAHGLYEIREEARDFVARENSSHQGQWEAGDPNLKVFVPRCAVPLKVQWDTIRWTTLSAGGESLQRSRRVIAVMCTRTASLLQGQKQWVVHVPVEMRK